jgi:hypothetical protein
LKGVAQERLMAQIKTFYASAIRKIVDCSNSYKTRVITLENNVSNYCVIIFFVKNAFNFVLTFML